MRVVKHDDYGLENYRSVLRKQMQNTEVRCMA